MRILSVVLLVLSSSVASAATPSEGVALKVRRGFFTETDVGVFMTVGGDNAYSNLQSYLQLGVGYNIGENVELGVHFGIGANAQNCFAGLVGAAQLCSASDNFTVSFLNASAAYLFRVAPRFYVSPKLTGGYTLLEPAPVDQIRGGANVGVGVGIEYVTQMDHFSIGLDVTSRVIVGPNIISLMAYPRVKYTF